VSFEDDASKATAAPGPAIPEARKAALDALPVEELAELWRRLQHVAIRDRTDEVWDDIRYFEHLPRDDPDRAYDLVLGVLAQEAGATDRSVLIQLGSKFLASLVHRHGDRLIDRIERDAPTHAGLRWLLGSAYWWARGEVLKARLKALADIAGWNADKAALEGAEPAIDLAALTTAELARVWSDQHGRPDKDRGENWQALHEFEGELNRVNPDRVIDLILEILTFETDQGLLGYLAAGLLENVIDHRTIDRIEREAGANDRFRWLLGGVWYWTDPEDIQERLDAIVQGRHWPN
jgi:hypothetical protein